MNITKPNELIGKQVYDDQGSAVGILDKYWNSWKKQHGYVFGIRPFENIRDTWFRGTTKLIPFSTEDIKDTIGSITLKKTLNDLSIEWRKAISIGHISYAQDNLMEKGIYDSQGSRVGSFYAWSEKDNTNNYYGCFIDSYLSETWQYPYGTILPLRLEYLNYATDTITLHKTLEELKTYWDNYQKTTKPMTKNPPSKQAKPKKQTKNAKPSPKKTTAKKQVTTH